MPDAGAPSRAAAAPSLMLPLQALHTHDPPLLGQVAAVSRESLVHLLHPTTDHLHPALISALPFRDKC
eukprot:scaffold20706_cov148-Isochrysis_galbana.AAC.3